MQSIAHDALFQVILSADDAHMLSMLVALRRTCKRFYELTEYGHGAGLLWRTVLLRVGRRHDVGITPKTLYDMENFWKRMQNVVAMTLSVRDGIPEVYAEASFTDEEVMGKKVVATSKKSGDDSSLADNWHIEDVRTTERQPAREDDDGHSLRDSFSTSGSISDHSSLDESGLFLEPGRTTYRADFFAPYEDLQKEWQAFARQAVDEHRGPTAHKDAAASSEGSSHADDDNSDRGHLTKSNNESGDDDMKKLSMEAALELAYRHMTTADYGDIAWNWRKKRNAMRWAKWRIDIMLAKDELSGLRACNAMSFRHGPKAHFDILADIGADPDDGTFWRKQCMHLGALNQAWVTESYVNTMRFVVLGASGVGKSRLLDALNRFNLNVNPSLPVRSQHIQDDLKLYSNKPTRGTRLVRRYHVSFEKPIMFVPLYVHKKKQLMSFWKGLVKPEEEATKDKSDGDGGDDDDDENENENEKDELSWPEPLPFYYAPLPFTRTINQSNNTASDVKSSTTSSVSSTEKSSATSSETMNDGEATGNVFTALRGVRRHAMIEFEHRKTPIRALFMEEEFPTRWYPRHRGARTNGAVFVADCNTLRQDSALPSVTLYDAFHAAMACCRGGAVVVPVVCVNAGLRLEDRLEETLTVTRGNGQEISVVVETMVYNYSEYRAFRMTLYVSRLLQLYHLMDCHWYNVITSEAMDMDMFMLDDNGVTALDDEDVLLADAKDMERADQAWLDAAVEAQWKAQGGGTNESSSDADNADDNKDSTFTTTSTISTTSSTSTQSAPLGSEANPVRVRRKRIIVEGFQEVPRKERIMDPYSEDLTDLKLLFAFPHLAGKTPAFKQRLTLAGLRKLQHRQAQKFLWILANGWARACKSQARKLVNGISYAMSLNFGNSLFQVMPNRVHHFMTLYDPRLVTAIRSVMQELFQPLTQSKQRQDLEKDEVKRMRRLFLDRMRQAVDEYGILTYKNIVQCNPTSRRDMYRRFKVKRKRLKAWKEAKKASKEAKKASKKASSKKR